jgi:histidinol-phosphate aminotransferase
MTISNSYPTTRVPTAPYCRATPRNQSTLRLDGNEGDTPPSLLLRRLASLDTSALREYPGTTELELELANRFGVDPQRVVVTAGADDALDRVCRAYLEPGRELLVPIPTFEMIHRFAAIAGGTIITEPWLDSFPTNELVAKIGFDTALVAIVSPNNPTGLVASAADFERIAKAATSAYVLLDHAYVEYADADLTQAALEHENVLVVRTFSKAWGLAGCRVGYLIATPDVANLIRNAGNPYPVSALSLSVVSERLRVGQAAMRAHVARIRDERERLRDHLNSLGVFSPPSQGNFLFAELGDRANSVHKRLASCGVLVRYFPQRQETRTGLRISLPGNEEDFLKLAQALNRCLAPTTNQEQLP